jgi:hypothetical protein
VGSDYPNQTTQIGAVNHPSQGGEYYEILERKAKERLHRKLVTCFHYKKYLPSGG